MTLHGTPLAKEMTEWWQTHAGRHADPKWLAYLEDFNYLLAHKLDEQAAEHDNHGRFGMSKAGGCTRAAALKLMRAEAQELSGSSRVTFWYGHMAEVMAIATLRAIGVPVTPSTDDGGQFTCRIDPFMHSTTDGLIAADPRLGNIPTMLSVKSAGYKMSGRQRGGGFKRYGFAQYPFDGVKVTNPGYWAQAQAEMHSRGHQQHLFVLVAKDIIKAMEEDDYLGPKGNGSLVFYTEIIPYDSQFISDRFIPAWTDAWSDARRGVPGAARYLSKDGTYVALQPGDADGNKKLTGTFDPCSYCDFRDACMGSSLTAQLQASIAAKAQQEVLV